MASVYEQFASCVISLSNDLVIALSSPLDKYPLVLKWEKAKLKKIRRNGKNKVKWKLGEMGKTRRNGKKQGEMGKIRQNWN
jgi:hypothetical protein